MKTRYKILLLNVAVTLLYCLGFVIFLPQQTEDLKIVPSIITALSWAFLFLVNYNWIHLIWLGLIVVGIIKKKREFIYGGIFSIILSALILFIFIVSIQY